MAPSTPSHQCPCGNIRLTVDDANGSVDLSSLSIKVPLMSLREASQNLYCLNCSTRVVSSLDGAGGTVGSARVVPVCDIAPNADHFSACFGIAILDPGVSENNDPSKGSNLKSALDDNTHLTIADKHARRIGLRAHFENWKQALLRDTERRILEAQAQCAWLCDRIQEAEGVCETSEEHIGLVEEVEKDPLLEDDKLSLPAQLCETRPPREPSPTLHLVSSASLPTPIPIQHSAPISKEPIPTISSDSPIVGSLLSRRISLAASASSLPPPGTPQVLLPVSVNPAGLVSASAGNVNQGGGISARSSGPLPRKVHFKDTSAPSGSGLAATTISAGALPSTSSAAPAALTTPLVTEPTNASASVSMLLPRQVDKLGSKPLPSPAPPGGGIFKFVAGVEAEDDEEDGNDEEDELFDMDGTVKDVARYGSSVEEETEEDEEEFDDAQEQQPVSLLSSSVPVSIMQDPSRVPIDRKKKKGGDTDENAFMAPHEIVAQSYKQQGLEGGVGSVVGKPVVVGAASYKKGAL